MRQSIGRSSSKRKPPSRVRYEQGHPTVSCRIPREIYDRLDKIKQAEGRSFADVLKVGLGIFEVRAREESMVRKKAYAEGRKAGYAEAERLFGVTYPCSICSQTLTVTNVDEKAALRTYMQEHGWAHKACIESRQR